MEDSSHLMITQLPWDLTVLIMHKGGLALVRPEAESENPPQERLLTEKEGPFKALLEPSPHFKLEM